MRRPVHSSNGRGAKPLAGGCVRIGIEADPEALLPYATSGASSTDILGFLFQQLAEVGPDLRSFEPRLAESWTWEDAHRRLEMRLRDGLRWSDGAPLGAEDVAFSFDVARDDRIGWPGAPWKSRIEGCDVIDSHTVRFRFASTWPDQLMDANTGFIVPAHRLRHVPRDRWKEAAAGFDPVCSGPFVVAEWERGVRIVLARNPHYQEPDRPRLERVEFVVLTDPEERVRALREGRIDFLPQVPEQSAPELRAAYAAGTSDVRVVAVRGRQYDFVCYNPTHPALGGRDVRCALTLAIDREAIIRTFCSGLAEPFESPIVPILWAYDADAPLTPYDPRAARTLLEASGWREAGSDGIRSRDGVRLAFELVTNVESARRVGATGAISAYWRMIGVQAEVRYEGRNKLLERLDAHRYDAALSGWRARLKPDLEPMWGTSSIGSKTNRVHYGNAEVDRLNAAALRCADLDEAHTLFSRAQRLVAADHPYTWLYYLHDVVAIHERVGGATVDARSAFIDPQDWWVEPAPLARPGARR